MKQGKQKGILGAMKIGAVFVLTAVLGQSQPAGNFYVRAEETGTMTVAYDQLRELLKQGNISLKKTLQDRQGTFGCISGNMGYFETGAGKYGG